MHKVGSVDQLNAALLRLRQNLAEGLQRRRMWMTDSDGPSLFFRAAESQFELLADRGDFCDIIEEGNIPEGGAHSQALRGVVGDSRGGGTTVHVK